MLFQSFETFSERKVWRNDLVLQRWETVAQSTPFETSRWFDWWSHCSNVMVWRVRHMCVCVCVCVMEGKMEEKLQKRRKLKLLKGRRSEAEIQSDGNLHCTMYMCNQILGARAAGTAATAPTANRQQQQLAYQLSYVSFLRLNLLAQ